MRGLSSSSTVDRVGTYAASGFKHAGSRDTLFAKAPRNPRKIYAARRFSRNGFRVFPTFDTLYDIVDTTLRAPLHCYPCCFGILLFFYSSCARRRLDIISSEFSPLLPLKFTAECSHGNLIEAALISWAFFFVFFAFGRNRRPGACQRFVNTRVTRRLLLLALREIQGAVRVRARASSAKKDGWLSGAFCSDAEKHTSGRVPRRVSTRGAGRLLVKKHEIIHVPGRGLTLNRRRCRV